MTSLAQDIVKIAMLLEEYRPRSAIIQDSFRHTADRAERLDNVLQELMQKHNELQHQLALAHADFACKVFIREDPATMHKIISLQIETRYPVWRLALSYAHLYAISRGDETQLLRILRWRTYLNWSRLVRHELNKALQEVQKQLAQGERTL
jgi:DNA-binding IclR family transcriptional regulator